MKRIAGEVLPDSRNRRHFLGRYSVIPCLCHWQCSGRDTTGRSGRHGTELDHRALVIDSAAWPRRRTRLAKGNPQVRRWRRSAARPHAGRRRPDRASVRARKRWSQPRAALRWSPLSMSPLRRGDGVSARIPLGSRAIPKGCRMRRRQIPRAWKSLSRKARTSRRGWSRASKTPMPVKARFAPSRFARMMCLSNISSRIWTD